MQFAETAITGGKRQRCPRRDDMLGWVGRAPEPPPNEGPEDGPDEWREGPGGFAGSKTGPHCSYCGSLHPQTFLDAVEAGDKVSGTDKSYKAYISGAVTGSDKFYFQHLSLEQRQRFVDLHREKKMHTDEFGFYVKPYFMRLNSSQGVTTDRNDPRLQQIEESGQQQAYLVAPTERRREYVRPVRTAYIHLTCGTTTTMGLQIAETYAADPTFYSGTFCVTCKAHFPVGPDGEFVWAGTDEKVGT